MRLAIPDGQTQIRGKCLYWRERADIIRRALRRAPEVVLQDLLRDSRDRLIIAITFLAMLEMAKTREVVIEQREPWGPIHCRRWAPTAEPVGEPVA